MLCAKRVKPGGYYMYRQFDIQQFYILPTQCTSIYVFFVDLRTAFISLYSIN